MPGRNPLSDFVVRETLRHIEEHEKVLPIVQALIEPDNDDSRDMCFRHGFEQPFVTSPDLLYIRRPDDAIRAISSNDVARSSKRPRDPSQLAKLIVPLQGRCRHILLARANPSTWSSRSRSCCDGRVRCLTHDEMVIEGLSEEEGEAFLVAVQS